MISDGICPGESSDWAWLLNNAGLQSVWELTCLKIVPDGGYGLSEPVLSRASVWVSTHMLARLERISLCFIPSLLASSNTFILCPKWEHFKDHSLQADSFSSSVIGLRCVRVCVWRSNIYKMICLNFKWLNVLQRGREVSCTVWWDKVVTIKNGKMIGNRQSDWMKYKCACGTVKERCRSQVASVGRLWGAGWFASGLFLHLQVRNNRALHSFTIRVSRSVEMPTLL